MSVLSVPAGLYRFCVRKTKLETRKSKPEEGRSVLKSTKKETLRGNVQAAERQKSKSVFAETTP